MQARILGKYQPVQITLECKKEEVLLLDLLQKEAWSYANGSRRELANTMLEGIADASKNPSV